MRDPVGGASDRVRAWAARRVQGRRAAVEVVWITVAARLHS
ncbi:hypothetical protein [Nonomuraea sp. NPDC050643]